MDGNDTVMIRSAEGDFLRFASPSRIVIAERQEDVLPALNAVEEAIKAGMTVAGFVAYEACKALDGAFKASHSPGVPLVWFGLYESVDRVGELPVPSEKCAEGEWVPSVSEEEYRAAIRKIRSYIESGDTYQVNYTMRLSASFAGSAYALFYRLQAAQGWGPAAFIETDSFAICSASPELFFEIDGDRITARPMKGTAARGLTYEDDMARVGALHMSEKNRAENVMIVDMIRNDLGRVAETDTVSVSKMYEVERYPTVLQMTSTVEAATSSGLTAMMRAMFPCASVTGAPKIRTMEIIDELETSARGVYTGAIGYWTPERKARFSVPIRTAVVNKTGGTVTYGVGGGIVWDSVDSQEYAECMTKAAVLTEVVPVFELLETILWQGQGGYYLLERHIRRMGQSADYFGFRFAGEDVLSQLDAYSAGLTAGAARVRVLVNKRGSIRIEHTPIDLAKTGHTVRVGFAGGHVATSNRFLYHKTTNRNVYEEARASRPDCDDVIICNERGEVTESTVANVVVEMDGKKLTPVITSGLLGGTFRAELLERGEIEEAVLRPDDLHKAERIFLVNSVRKWVPAVLVDR